VDGFNLTVAITGASGATFAASYCAPSSTTSEWPAFTLWLQKTRSECWAEELAVSGRNDLLEKLLDAAPKKTVQHSDADIGAAIASGSYPSNGMIVLPCSMGTLAQSPTVSQRADCPCRGRIAQRAAPVNPLRPRDPLQSHPSSQHDTGSRGRRRHFSCNSGLLQQAHGLDRDGPPVRLPRPRPHRPSAARRLYLEGG